MILASCRLTQQSDITFSILLKPEHIEENTLGPNGIVQAGKKGLIHVEMSTMHPTWQKALAGKLAAKGIEMLDAPISGSHNRVDARTISIMVGGKPEVFERVRPILEPSLSQRTGYRHNLSRPIQTAIPPGRSPLSSICIITGMRRR